MSELYEGEPRRTLAEIDDATLPELAWQFRYPAGLFRVSWGAAKAFGLDPTVPVKAMPDADDNAIFPTPDDWPGMSTTVVAPQEVWALHEPAFEGAEMTKALNRKNVSVIVEEDRINTLFYIPVTQNDPPDLQLEFFRSRYAEKWPAEMEDRLAAESGFAYVAAHYVTAMSVRTAIKGLDRWLDEHYPILLEGPVRKEAISDYAVAVSHGIHVALCDEH